MNTWQKILVGLLAIGLVGNLIDENNPSAVTPDPAAEDRTEYVKVAQKEALDECVAIKVERQELVKHWATKEEYRGTMFDYDYYRGSGEYYNRDPQYYLNQVTSNNGWMDANMKMDINCLKHTFIAKMIAYDGLGGAPYRNPNSGYTFSRILGTEYQNHKDNGVMLNYYTGQWSCTVLTYQNEWKNVKCPGVPSYAQTNGPT